MGVRVKGSGVENETALTAMYVHILQAISPAIFIRLEFESILDSCCSVQPEEAAPAPSVAVAPAAGGSCHTAVTTSNMFRAERRHIQDGVIRQYYPASRRKTVFSDCVRNWVYLGAPHGRCASKSPPCYDVTHENGSVRGVRQY